MLLSAACVTLALQKLEYSRSFSHLPPQRNTPCLCISRGLCIIRGPKVLAHLLLRDEVLALGACNNPLS